MNDGTQVHWDKPNEFNSRRTTRREMSRASECETEDLGISDGGKGARLCEDAGTWKMMYSTASKRNLSFIRTRPIYCLGVAVATQ